MELDEALVKITELNEEIENQKTINQTLSESKSLLEQENQRLKESNMKLFLKVTGDDNREEKIDIPKNNEETESFNDFVRDWDL